MKRTMRKKLGLTRESLRRLDAGTLERAAGGRSQVLTECACPGRSLILTECDCTARVTSCLECFQYPPQESFPCGETNYCGTL